MPDSQCNVVCCVGEPELSNTSLDPTPPTMADLKDVDCCDVVAEQMNQLAAELQHPCFHSSNNINGF